MNTETHEEVNGNLESWLDACLSSNNVTVSTTHRVKRNEAREVWDCVADIDGEAKAVVLTIFKPGPLECVNTSLQPHDVARKCALAFTELPLLHIPTPSLLGHAECATEAAIVCEKVESAPWDSPVRLQAAAVLARLHGLGESDLSPPLQDLTRVSDPRATRTTGGEAPSSGMRALVHGDYFSANILPVSDGLRIIDWETFGWGDPMWDLGFLIGADPGLPPDEVETVIAEYESTAPVKRDCLMWHKRRWDDFWEHRRKRTV